MKCEAVQSMISSYIDKDLNDIEKQEFEKHLSECPKCREEFESLYEIAAICGSFEEIDLPSDFRTDLHQRLLKEKKKQFGGFFGIKGMKAVTGLVAAVLVIAIGIGSGSLFNGKATKSASEQAPNFAAGAANGAAPAAYYDTKGDAGVQSQETYHGPEVSFSMADTAQPAADPVSPATKRSMAITFSEEENAAQFNENVKKQKAEPMEQNSARSGRMVIRTGNIALKVANVDSSVEEIRKMAEKIGGYVENSQVDNVPLSTVESVRGNSVVRETTSKYANMSIRIPAEKFESTFSAVKALGKFVNENISGSDITAQYRDTYTRAENLKIQEKSLQQLMTKAKNVDEILRIETELNRVRTEIDMLSGDLKRWDDLVQLSTIHISLTEVKEEELKKVDVPGILGQAYNGFIGAVNNVVTGLERIFVVLVAAIPYLIVVGVLAAIGTYIAKKIKARKI